MIWIALVIMIIFGAPVWFVQNGGAIFLNNENIVAYWICEGIALTAAFISIVEIIFR